jgi:hypothetical protein
VLIIQHLPQRYAAHAGIERCDPSRPTSLKTSKMCDTKPNHPRGSPTLTSLARDKEDMPNGKKKCMLQGLTLDVVQILS